MSLPDWHEEPISKKHDRASFDCGEPVLNDFLRRRHSLGGRAADAAIAPRDHPFSAQGGWEAVRRWLAGDRSRVAHTDAGSGL
jgi:hypothetical protein